MFRRFSCLGKLNYEKQNLCFLNEELKHGEGICVGDRSVFFH